MAVCVWALPRLSGSARERGFRQGHDSTGREREGRRGIDGGERRMCLRGKKETRLRKSGKTVRDVATETKCTVSTFLIQIRE